MGFKKSLITDYVVLFLGCFLTALAIALFLVPNRIVAGGVSGLAIVVYELVGWPVGIQMLGYNMGLFALGFWILGARFGIKSIVSSVTLSLLVDFFSYIFPLSAPDLSKDPLLAPIYGGVIAGIGMGLVFWKGASTGGTDIIAMIIKRFSSISTGFGLLIVDSSITFIAMIVFGPIIVLYGIIAIFVTTKVIDGVLEGIENTRSVWIISDQWEEIKEEVFQKLERGATIVPGMGAYTRKDRPVLWIVIRRREISLLRGITLKHDPNAFMIVQQNTEVFGEGFKRLKF